MRVLKERAGGATTGDLPLGKLGCTIHFFFLLVCLFFFSLFLNGGGRECVRIIAAGNNFGFELGAFLDSEEKSGVIQFERARELWMSENMRRRNFISKVKNFDAPEQLHF